MDAVARQEMTVRAPSVEAQVGQKLVPEPMFPGAKSLRRSEDAVIPGRTGLWSKVCHHT